jgi:hypothetical protein
VAFPLIPGCQHSNFLSDAVSTNEASDGVGKHVVVDKTKQRITFRTGYDIFLVITTIRISRHEAVENKDRYGPFSSVFCSLFASIRSLCVPVMETVRSVFQPHVALESRRRGTAPSISRSTILIRNSTNQWSLSAQKRAHRH